MWSKGRRAVNLLLILILVLSGCVAVPESKHPPLRVEWTFWDGDFTLVIAHEKGFFEQYGLEVEPVYYETFSASIADMAAGRLDGGLFGLGDVLLTSSVIDVRGVAVYDSGGTSSVVARQEINAISDLIGKRIGVLLGSYNELFVREMLLRAGLTVNDVTLVNVDPEKITARLADDLDAGYVYAPFDTQAVQAGFKILYSSSESDVGAFFPDVITFRKSIVEERPEDVRAFLKAWFEALEYRMANSVECNQIVARILDVPVERVTQSSRNILYTLDDNTRLYDPNSSSGITIYDAAKLNLDFQVARGNITLMPEIDQIFDSSYLQSLR